MRGGHHSINPYLKNLPPVVRRNLHVVNTKYLEQQCTCKNHVQCDIYPVPLTTEVVLPTYPHFLNVHNLFGAISRETNILGDYGKTIQMMILARVNGYYSPFFLLLLHRKKSKLRLAILSTWQKRTSSDTDYIHYIQRLMKKVSSQP